MMHTYVKYIVDYLSVYRLFKLRNIHLGQPIFVVGAPRSGTSLTAGCLNLCGAWAGNTRPYSKHNLKGNFENRRLKRKMTKPLLLKLGSDPRGQKSFPVKPSPPVKDWDHQVKKHLVREGYLGGTWLFKDPKMTLQWETWDNAFPAAKWIIVRRKQEGVVNSCLRTSFMDAHDDKSSWIKFVEAYEARMSKLKSSVSHCRELSTDRLASGDYTELEDVVNWLGLCWQQRKIEQFVSPDLWHF